MAVLKRNTNKLTKGIKVRSIKLYFKILFKIIRNFYIILLIILVIIVVIKRKCRQNFFLVHKGGQKLLTIKKTKS